MTASPAPLDTNCRPEASSGAQAEAEIPTIFASDVSSALTERECRRLAELGVGRRALELGSHLGRSTIALASTAAIVHAVDWHLGDEHVGLGETLTEFWFNLTRYGVRQKVAIHVMRFEQAAATLIGGFDVVFVDGRHDAESVVRDARLAQSLAAPKAELAFHDWRVENAGFAVAEALTAVFGREPDEVVDTLAIYRQRLPGDARG